MTIRADADGKLYDVDTRICPHCRTDLRGPAIPEEYFVHHLEGDPSWDRAAQGPSCEKQVEMWGRCHCLPYGDKPPEDRFFLRTIGHEVNTAYDGILFWSCPDCGGTWHRWPEGHHLRVIAARYM